jgi:hypothetical protein
MELYFYSLTHFRGIMLSYVGGNITALLLPAKRRSVIVVQLVVDKLIGKSFVLSGH